MTITCIILGWLGVEGALLLAQAMHHDSHASAAACLSAESNDIKQLQNALPTREQVQRRRRERAAVEVGAASSCAAGSDDDDGMGSFCFNRFGSEVRPPQSKQALVDQRRPGQVEKRRREDEQRDNEPSEESDEDQEPDNEDDDLADAKEPPTHGRVRGKGRTAAEKKADQQVKNKAKRIGRDASDKVDPKKHQGAIDKATKLFNSKLAALSDNALWSGKVKSRQVDQVATQLEQTASRLMPLAQHRDDVVPLYEEMLQFAEMAKKKHKLFLAFRAKPLQTFLMRDRLLALRVLLPCLSPVGHLAHAGADCPRRPGPGDRVCRGDGPHLSIYGV